MFLVHFCFPLYICNPPPPPLTSYPISGLGKFLRFILILISILIYSLGYTHHKQQESPLQNYNMSLVTVEYNIDPLPSLIQYTHIPSPTSSQTYTPILSLNIFPVFCSRMLNVQHINHQVYQQISDMNCLPIIIIQQEKKFINILHFIWVFSLYFNIELINTV